MNDRTFKLTSIFGDYYNILVMSRIYEYDTYSNTFGLVVGSSRFGLGFYSQILNMESFYSQILNMELLNNFIGHYRVFYGMK